MTESYREKEGWSGRGTSSSHSNSSTSGLAPERVSPSTGGNKDPTLKFLGVTPDVFGKYSDWGTRRVVVEYGERVKEIGEVAVTDRKFRQPEWYEGRRRPGNGYDKDYLSLGKGGEVL